MEAIWELPSEQPNNQEFTGELPSEPLVIGSDVFSEEGLSRLERADLQGVAAQPVNRIRRQGNLHKRKVGWRAVKINEKENRYYLLNKL